MHPCETEVNKLGRSLIWISTTFQVWLYDLLDAWSFSSEFESWRPCWCPKTTNDPGAIMIQYTYFLYLQIKTMIMKTTHSADTVNNPGMRGISGSFPRISAVNNDGMKLMFITPTKSWQYTINHASSMKNVVTDDGEVSVSYIISWLVLLLCVRTVLILTSDNIIIISMY